MLFNSYIFIFLFLPLALGGWYLLNCKEKYKLAQMFLIGMSLWFYAYFNISYLAVILLSCALNYGISLAVYKKDTLAFRKIMLVAGCVLNLGVLGYFKYYDFFVENMNTLLQTDFNLKHILLPLGISFFTFQQLSFVIDRCKGNSEHYELLDYLCFVTFFPQLIAGPIVLHTELIPQFKDRSRRRFDSNRFAYGIAWFTFGLAKKVLLADNLAPVVEYGFSHITGLDTLSAWVIALAYTLELYFDFSGYCDMAVGIGKMFGIEIPDNFNAPFQSASVKEFWRRWHMTLGRFFTTYVYIPLGGSRKGKRRTVVNTMVVFFLSGLWHGANWTFVFWGVMHGVAVAVNSLQAGWSQRLFGGDGKQKRVLRVVYRRLAQFITFLFVCVAFVFFRSDSMADGMQYMKQLTWIRDTERIFIVADCLEVPELYMVTKVLSMTAQNMLPYVNLAALFAMLLFGIWLITGKTTRQRLTARELTVGFSWKLTILFVWSVLSLSGVSTFLYFNF